MILAFVFTPIAMGLLWGKGVLKGRIRLLVFLTLGLDAAALIAKKFGY